jgi:hypothetical protein
MQTDIRRARMTFGRRGRSYAWLAAPATAVLAAMAFSGPATAATPAPAGATSYVPAQGLGATTQGIIMRDGGICDPIRHIGC